MKDFDFDELDRAVSSALSGSSPATPTDNAQQPDGAANLTAETVVNLDSAATKDALIEPNPIPAPATPPAPLQTPVQPRQAFASRPGTGRAMDIVHGAGVPPRPIARPAVTPVAPKESPVEVLDAPVVPLESPFLPDAVVEKRPLGGPVAAPQPADLLLEAPDDPLLEALNLPDPIDFSASETTEQADEASVTVEAVEAPSTPEVQEVDEAPVLTTISDLEAQKVDTELIDIDAAIEPEAYAPTAITQQYKEQPSSAVESGAIFDTEAYHQPLSAPVKRKSGLKAAIIVALLAILGAGLGVVFYLYVLPLL